MRRRVIANIGGFDVENFGDLLFPLIAELRLKSVCDKVVHVAPLGGPAPWQGCVTPISFDEFLYFDGELDGIMIGGGHTIHAKPTSLDSYCRTQSRRISHLAYPMMWLGAAHVASERGIPLCWNGPGVPRPFHPSIARLVQWASSESIYISVRDEVSRQYMRDVGVRRNIEVIPDSALDVQKIWNYKDLEATYHEVLRSAGFDPDITRTLVIHLKSRYCSDDLAQIAMTITRVCEEMNAIPILVALGPCHGDGIIQRETADFLSTPNILIDKPKSLLDVVACIANSEGYIGSSLHGMITAYAFERPGIIVASERAAGFTKFSGFLRHIGKDNCLCESWLDADLILSTLPHKGTDHAPEWRHLAYEALDKHWREISRCFHGSFSSTYLNRRSAQASKTSAHIALRPSVSIVICIHNAWEEVRKCLNSVLRAGGSTDLIIIDDGSDEILMDLVQSLGLPPFTLVRNTQPRGYTVAANQGLRAAKGDFVILLNSDTEVPGLWIDKLVECAASDESVGMVGPLSNAGGWQSVPEIVDSSGDWKVNTLPEGMDVHSMDLFVECTSSRMFPKVGLLNGFCLGIKRHALEKVGYFDEESFPLGYGEEFDYCMRAKRFGFKLAIADHLFIFHGKSRSYGHTRRKELSRRASAKLRSLYGEQISIARKQMSSDSQLAEIRSRIEKIYRNSF